MKSWWCHWFYDTEWPFILPVLFLGVGIFVIGLVFL